MKFKNQSLISIGILVALAVCFLFAEMGVAQTTTYNQANKLILEEKWQDAHDAMLKFIERYPKSSYVDDAEYWKCYAQEKLAGNTVPELGKTFEAYETFVEKYPDSKWVDDAQANMIRLGLYLADLGNENYMLKVQQLQKAQNDEIALAALYALGNADEKTVLPPLMELYTRTENIKIRQAILSMLIKYKSEEATKYFLDIARAEQNTDLLSYALSSISRREPGKYFDVLEEIIWKEDSLKVLQNHISTLARADSAKRDPLFVKIITTHKNPDIRAYAFSALSSRNIIKNPAFIPAIEAILFGDFDEDIQSTALSRLLRMDGKASLPLIIKVAKTHKNMAFRKDTIEFLGKSKDPRAVKALLEIIKRY
ncbi:hypothetical protein AMJ80_07005 [bacterium SM23_31]|nr:MAG: hypothetical protein AMJ80_07005 [bacterium SM23_31]